MRTDLTPESDPDENLTADLDWLADESEVNPGWLRIQAAEVYDILRAGLNSQHHYRRTLQVIVGFIAPVVADDVWKPWFDRIADMLETPLEGNPYEAAVCEATAKFREQVGVYGRLKQVRPAQVDALLQAHITLFRAVIYLHGFKLPQQLIDQAITVARQLNDHIERSKLFQTLALYYFHAEDASLAESYAKLALSEYEFIEHTVGSLDAALTMAAICRGSLRYSRAEYFIQRVIDMHLPLQRDKRLATLFYEYAANCYLNDKFDTALSYYQRALEIYEEFDARYQITMTHHALALVYIHLREYEKAKALVLDARQQWEVLGNQYEWVNSFFVEADLELKRGERSLGVKKLRYAIDMAYTTLEDTPARENLVNSIRDHIERHMMVAVH